MTTKSFWRKLFPKEVGNLPELLVLMLLIGVCPERVWFIYRGIGNGRFLLLFLKPRLVVTKWLNLRGWKVALSPAGRIAKQMIRQLGGTIGTWTLAKKGIIQLLEEMNSSDGKSISESHLHGTIAKIANQTGSKRTAKIIFQRLVERKVFPIGHGNTMSRMRRIFMVFCKKC